MGLCEPSVRIASRRPRSGVRLLLLPLATALFLLSPASSPAAGKDAGAPRAIISLDTVSVASKGNPSVGIIPFTDAIYPSCELAPASTKTCQEIGSVDYRYDIGHLEITVAQWVAFLNTVDPDGKDRHDLYDPTESSKAWPRFGQINNSTKAKSSRHYSVASPAWANKPYGFADFLRAARFVNSVTNGDLLAKRETVSGGFEHTMYRVRLSRTDDRGMYDLRRDKKAGAQRSARKGFAVTSQDEWVKAAYFDPTGGGTNSYWKYPTNPGVFGDGSATAPTPTTLNPTTGDVTNAATQPIASYHDADLPAPAWCPAAIQPQSDCSDNPFGLDPTNYDKIYQGSLSTAGGAKTTSPWGTLDQGGNAVEWTDTITPAPDGKSPGRVWRRMHGGVSNAPAYQLWLSAVGLQPQDNKVFDLTYPWLGFRVAVIGKLKPKGKG